MSIKVGTLAGAVLPEAAALEELSSPQATKEATATAASGNRIFLEIIVTPYERFLSRYIKNAAAPTHPQKTTPHMKLI
jgi:hypothetical protein